MIEEESIQNPWEIFSIGLAILAVIALIAFPIYLKNLINLYIEECETLDEPQESQFYKLFEYYRVSKEAMKYLIIFLIRRYILISTLILLHS